MCTSSPFKTDAPFATIVVANSTKIPDELLAPEYDTDSFVSVETSSTTSLDSGEAHLLSEVEEKASEDHSSSEQAPIEEHTCGVSRHTDGVDGNTVVQAISPKKSKRNVSFSTVLVRDYGMVLGDHPGCSYGLPVQLGWEYDEYEPLDIDYYEISRDRRTHRQMLLNYYVRIKLLTLAGHTEKELKTAAKEHKKTKILRSLTRQLVPCYHVEAALESACRKFKRVLKEDHWKQEKPLYQKSQRDCREAN